MDFSIETGSPPDTLSDWKAGAQAPSMKIARAAISDVFFNQILHLWFMLILLQ
jgi:hypothetical protein